MVNQTIFKSALVPRATLTLMLVSMLSGCGSPVQLNLVVYDPCNQQSLPDAKHIQFEILDNEGEPQGTIWDSAEKSGELLGVSPPEDAIVMVTARDASASGQPGVAIAAGGAGYFDLSTAEDGNLVELNVAIGRVDAFMRTTDLFQQPVQNCSDAVAERRGHRAAVLPNGEVWMIGGLGYTLGSDGISRAPSYWFDTEFYEPKTGRFVNGPETTGFTQIGHTLTKLDDGSVMAVGGAGVSISSDGLSTVSSSWRVAHILDSETKTIAVRQSSEARVYHSATKLADGRVLLAGGQDRIKILPDDGATFTTLSSTEVYNPQTQSFEPGPALQLARSHHSAVRVDDLTVALIGGQTAGGLVPQIEFVTVGSAQTIVGPSLSVPRSWAVSHFDAEHNAVVIAGGFRASLQDPTLGTEATANVELLRLGSGDFSSSAVVCTNLTLSSARGALASAVLPEGILVAGGLNEAGQVLPSAERIVVQNVDSCSVDIVQTAGSMAFARADFDMAAMPGGDILVTGGFSFDATGEAQTVAAGEIYVFPRL